MTRRKPSIPQRFETLDELRTLARYYGDLAGLAAKAQDVTESHSVEEARQRHAVKDGKH